MKRFVLFVVAALALIGRSPAAVAQCPVNAGWWVFQSPDKRIKLKFHVKPSGTSVDSLEIGLHAVCNSTGTKSFTSSGQAISCAPWRFTWSQACNAELWIDGFNLEVMFLDQHQAAATLDIVTWYEGCAVCRALTTSIIVGTAPSTWGDIKTLYDVRRPPTY